MLGLMQQRPLLISSLLDYAERYHTGTEIVSRSVEGPIHRSNWGEVATRARQIANALHRQGVVQGERIATLAWNHNRHLEIYFGVTCSGAVLHTVNPRLFLNRCGLSSMMPKQAMCSSMWRSPNW